MTRENRPCAAVAAVSFIATIALANYVTSRYGLIPVGFGQMATAGTYFAGLAFVLRDAVQDTGGRPWVWGAIAAGAALSFGLGSGRIAVASAVAFLLSEAADYAVYTPLRRRGYVRAAVASNVVGTLIDTVVFLSLAGFGLQQAFAGQVIGKLTVTFVVVGFLALYRETNRQAVTA